MYDDPAPNLIKGFILLPVLNTRLKLFKLINE